MTNVIFERKWAMPNGNTFTIAPIKDFVEQEVNKGGIIVDPFANKCKYGTITNDLNPEFHTTKHMDALEFLKEIDSNYADLVLYDPPYSITQASQLYHEYGKEKLEVNVANMKYWKLCKDNIARILKPNGRVICCGWNTNGLGKNRGFQLDKVLIVCHGGSKNDTLVTLEHKVK
ncbi:MAG: adenine-specific DNA methylase [Bacilli bacterium]|nr:adenine-specific DNA methylase [Bacilli bacterium]